MPNSGHRSSRGQRGKWASTKTAANAPLAAARMPARRKHVALILDQAQRDRQARGHHCDERRKGKKPDRDDQSRGGAGRHPDARQLHAAEDIAADSRRCDVAEEPADEAIQKRRGERHAAAEDAKHAREKQRVGEDDEDVSASKAPAAHKGLSPESTDETRAEVDFAKGEPKQEPQSPDT